MTPAFGDMSLLEKQLDAESIITVGIQLHIYSTVHVEEAEVELTWEGNTRE
jgi:hypothetical protein